MLSTAQETNMTGRLARKFVGCLLLIAPLWAHAVALTPAHNLVVGEQHIQYLYSQEYELRTLDTGSTATTFSLLSTPAAGPLGSATVYMDADPTDGAVSTGLFLGAIDLNGAMTLNLNPDSQYILRLFGFNPNGNLTMFDLKMNTINVAAVSAVPIPAAVWLFGSGLLGLLSFSRRGRAVPA
jgi:hypothetical protein